MNEVKIEEWYHNLTVPRNMYHLQPEVTAASRVGGIETSLEKQQGTVREQARELASTLNLKDASSEAIKPLSTPDVEKGAQKGKGRS